MIIFTREEMIEADSKMVELGLPSLILMEHAALRLLEHTKEGALIVCGPGNNGGDGLALARLLHLKNKKPRVLVQTKRPLRGDPLINLEVAKNLDVDLDFFYQDMAPLEKALDKASMVVDCLFGTGLSRDLRPPYSHSIELINNSGKFLLAADLPSGLDANTGRALGQAIRADKTISFHAMKKGMVGHPGVLVVDIGIRGYWD